MDPTDWQLTGDLDEFLSRAAAFLHSHPALHTVPLTVADALRRRGLHIFGDEPPLFGTLGGLGGGPVRAALFHTPPLPVHITPVTDGEADALAARLADRGHPVPGVVAARDTAAAFVRSWQRHTGAPADLHQRQRLYRLAELVMPAPPPQGRARTAGPADRELVARWYGEFMHAVGLRANEDAGAWADARISYGGITLWESPDGTPVSMAGVTRDIAGQTRVAPVYTPAHLRGHGYAGAVTAEVSRAALERSVGEVLLFTDLANPTSNGLYQRIGYRGVADFAVYGFGGRDL
ncbi:GNAT family N-acetyltransferase [Streptomyces sp. NK08204]|uniref:GNAT family N-acetyltransferase n=1 Tax=Streptomyces sp. NK08204 TaxID=2873260 RepID=UPI001CED93A8|nr:GNAT family N-acetyltransferase [Streptomyces sp. NK08204]